MTIYIELLILTVKMSLKLRRKRRVHFKLLDFIRLLEINLESNTGKHLIKINRIYFIREQLLIAYFSKKFPLIKNHVLDLAKKLWIN